jgi:hypothetical protein
MTYAASIAMLPGTENWNGTDIRYRSLLSVGGNNAVNRLNVAGPAYNRHGTLLATSKADLFDNRLLAPVDYDEFGTYILFDPDVWTGSSAGGGWSGQSCGNWNDPADIGRVGDAFVSDPAWLSAGFTKACVGTARLYGISPPIPSPLWGDYNEDGLVDTADYTVLRDSLSDELYPFYSQAYEDVGLFVYNLEGPPPWYPTVDAPGLYAAFANYYGQTLPPGAANAVPEPAAGLVALGVMLMVRIGRRRAG